MHRSLRAAFVVLVSGIIAFAASPSAAEDRDGLQELSVNTGYGWSQRDNIQVVPLYLRFGWNFPDLIDEPLHDHNINFEWYLEPWISGVKNHQNAVEFGLTMLGLKLEYDQGQQVVPFGIAGTGPMYTGLQGANLSGPFEFASFGGGGIKLFLTQQLALSFQYRFRHISNAGIKEPNPGLNTQFVLIGLESYPGR